MKYLLLYVLMLSYGVAFAQSNEIIGAESLAGVKLASNVIDYDIIQSDQQGNILWRKELTNTAEFDSTLNAYMVYSFTTIKNGKITSCPGDYDYWLVKRDTVINVNVYPNPANEYFYVMLDSYTDNIQFDLFDLNQKLISTYQLNGYSNTINLSKIANGMYMYKVYTTDKIIKTGKVCIMQNSSLR